MTSKRSFCMKENERSRKVGQNHEGKPNLVQVRGYRLSSGLSGASLKKDIIIPVDSGLWYQCSHDTNQKFWYQVYFIEITRHLRDSAKCMQTIMLFSRTCCIKIIYATQLPFWRCLGKHTLHMCSLFCERQHIWKYFCMLKWLSHYIFQFIINFTDEHSTEYSSGSLRCQWPRFWYISFKFAIVIRDITEFSYRGVVNIEGFYIFYQAPTTTVAFSPYSIPPYYFLSFHGHLCTLPSLPPRAQWT